MPGGCAQRRNQKCKNKPDEVGNLGALSGCPVGKSSWEGVRAEGAKPEAGCNPKAGEGPNRGRLRYGEK